VTALNLYIEEATIRKEKMIQATFSDSRYSDAKSLLDWDDERAAKFAAAEKKRKKEEEVNLLLR
jgi:hypothetical protein